MNALRRLSGTLTIDHVVAGFQKARDQLLALAGQHAKESTAHANRAADNTKAAMDHAEAHDRAQRIATKLGELVS